MTYNHVDLIQRGISSSQHAVSGKSGKLYGHAVHSPKDGGVSFRMSLNDYLEAAHDICGNTAPGQQWVPVLVADVSTKPARPKCDRCAKPSVAIWDRFPFCADHAPANATWYDEAAHQEWLKLNPATAVARPSETATPDVLPTMQEKMSPGVTDKNDELPPEEMAAPIMGTEKEGQDEEIPLALRRPGAQPPPAVASERVEPVAKSSAPAALAPKAVSVVKAITDSVIAAVIPQVAKMIDDRFAPIATPPKSTPPDRAPKKRRAHGNKPPTEFRALQIKAKSLGINPFGKSKKALTAEISKKEKGSEPK
jgi:hypothetical protein